MVEATVERLTTSEIGFRNLRTRRAGNRNFVYVDVHVPGHWTVRATHRELDRIEREIAAALPETVVFTHAGPSKQAEPATAGPAASSTVPERGGTGDH